MLYDVVLFSPVQQSKSVISIYIPFLLNLPPTSPHSSSLGLHRELSWAPCAIEQFPLAIYSTHGSVYMAMLLSQFISSSGDAEQGRHALLTFTVFQNHRAQVEFSIIPRF